MADQRDQTLGMGANITRRDFLNGVAITAGAAMIPPEMWAAAAADLEPQNVPGYYPPAKTGLRGDHPGSFEVMHNVRDGAFWDEAPKPADTGESYDLVVVGGGISGLAAAHYFRKAVGQKARILILDNHDDFGGHAQRNEFRTGNRTILGFGGTYSIESPSPYSAVSKALIEELGIDVPSYHKYVNKDIYRSLGLRPRVFFDKETFGADKLLVNPRNFGFDESGINEPAKETDLQVFLKDAPFSEKSKNDLQRLLTEKKDYFPGLSSVEKKARLARVSYAKFLTETVSVSDEVVKFFQAMPHPLFGVGIDAVPAQDAWGLGMPGFDGLSLDSSPGKGMNRDAIRNEEADKYFFHYPDGVATIARLLVRKLIPAAIPGNSATDVVLAKADYSKLDEASSPTRIRLNSTVVKVKHKGEPVSAKEVEVTYFTEKKLRTARAAHCILACWHVVIPYIAQELPDAQKGALASSQKVPLLYNNVLIRNWTAFQKLGANAIYAPGMYHTNVNLDLPVSIGGYECTKKPDEPIVVHMMKAACKPGRPAREQHKLGRIQLYTTTFETHERNIREQLARMLGPGGFDPARDIMEITVNRWPHGYSYEYNSLFDEFWLEGGELPCEVARKPFGRIAIANCDA
ncbi:MAG: NAD(P)/FAD-dependent oxidoreductase, partial [Candidatus Koribacter versatilis]|nr:NAD(P)/FAD-dependent oxidoreductase [Candidatus Koribacter versatilis]